MIKMTYEFREANLSDVESVWLILQQAIVRRRLDGSDQWQDGYPNPEVIERDILQKYGYVMVVNGEVIAYSAMMVNNEPAYDKINGQWFTENTDFLVLHRIAVADSCLGKGIAKEIFKKAEQFASSHHIQSIRVDTNFDNFPMLHVLEKLGYVYCGEVILRGGSRKGFEKVLSSEKENNVD